MTLFLGHIFPLWGFPGGSVIKNSPTNAGDTGGVGPIPGLERSPMGGKGNPLQYSCREDSMNRGASWATVRGVAKSDMTEHACTRFLPSLPNSFID